MTYTQEMKKAVRSVKIPHDFVIDIVEYNLKNVKFLAIRFYESQWEYYNENERLSCILYLNKVKCILEKFGARVTLEPVIDTGNNLPTKKRVRGKGITK